MRLADRQRGSVLGVNQGKLGFLAEVDMPALPGMAARADQPGVLGARDPT